MSKFKKIHADRLLTLAYFLKTEVKPENFDMESYVNGDYSQQMVDSLKQNKPECGTTACAIGYCPVAFPKDWIYAAGVVYPKLRRNSTGLTSGDSEEYFGLDTVEWNHLFDGEVQRTPKQEAKVIEQFVDSKGYTYAESTP